MLRKVEFENFMSLRQCEVNLEPLTVFVGANGSGKSAIFKGLVVLSKLLNGFPVRGGRGDFSLESGVTFDDIVWNGNSGLPIRFRVWFDGDSGDPSYTLELSKRAQGWGISSERMRVGDSERWIIVDQDNPFEFKTEQGNVVSLKPPLRATVRFLVHPYVNDSVARPIIEPIIQFGERFGQAWRYRPSASDIASFSLHSKPRYVRENGAGVALELQRLQGSEREVFEKIEKAVCAVFPHIKAIGFRADWQGVGLNYRTDRSQDLLPAAQESDGVLLATFLFWRLHTGGPNLTVCLEEPENGLHPFLLAERFRLLRACAYGDIGPSVQLLVATHSPEFLRAVKAHPTALWQELRIVRFEAGNGTLVSKLGHFRDATKLWEEYRDEMHARWEVFAKDLGDGQEIKRPPEGGQYGGRVPH